MLAKCYSYSYHVNNYAIIQSQSVFHTQILTVQLVASYTYNILSPKFCEQKASQSIMQLHAKVCFHAFEYL